MISWSFRLGPVAFAIGIGWVKALSEADAAEARARFQAARAA